MSLDEIHARILTALIRDARASYAAIGSEVGLSAPAVKRRVDRMLDRGVIKGFTTVIDRNVLGWYTEAYVQVFCHGTIAPERLRYPVIVIATLPQAGERSPHCGRERGDPR